MNIRACDSNEFGSESSLLLRPEDYVIWDI